MRCIVQGKSRSGKSTALHRLVRAALQGRWAAVLLADGKGVELPRYATPSQPVFGPDQAEAFAQALAATAARLSLRYTALTARGLCTALPGDPRELIIVDEIQVFSRDPKHGKAVRDALTRIFEQSGASAIWSSSRRSAPSTRSRLRRG